MKEIGQQIRKLRNIRGLTQAELGKLLKTSRNAISRLEDTGKFTNKLTIDKIATALQVPIPLITITTLIDIEYDFVLQELFNFIDDVRIVKGRTKDKFIVKLNSNSFLPALKQGIQAHERAERYIGSIDPITSCAPIHIFDKIENTYIPIRPEIKSFEGLKNKDINIIPIIISKDTEA